MRYLYVTALILFTGFYTCSHESYGGNGEQGIAADDDDNGNGNHNYLEVEAQSGLNFTVDQPEDFENTQVQANAIRLNLRTKGNDCTVFAKVSSYITPQGADKSSVPLELQYRSGNSGNTMNLITTPVQLSMADKRLFVQPKLSKPLYFYYDLRLMPLGYNYPEGQYSFTITYTMTQP